MFKKKQPGPPRKERHEEFGQRRDGGYDSCAPPTHGMPTEPPEPPLQIDLGEPARVVKGWAGAEIKFYSAATFARVMGVSTQALAEWTKLGYVPPAIPKWIQNVASDGIDPAGRRLFYSARQIHTAVELAVANNLRTRDGKRTNAHVSVGHFSNLWVGWDSEITGIVEAIPLTADRPSTPPGAPREIPLVTGDASAPDTKPGEDGRNLDNVYRDKTEDRPEDGPSWGAPAGWYWDDGLKRMLEAEDTEVYGAPWGGNGRGPSLHYTTDSLPRSGRRTDGLG